MLEGVEETVKKLSNTHKLLIITKGDLFDQESKIARSGIGDYFEHIEIVPGKTPDVYEKILTKQKITPENFMMVGNSLKSDVLPVDLSAERAFIFRIKRPGHTNWLKKMNLPNITLFNLKKFDNFLIYWFED